MENEKQKKETTMEKKKKGKTLEIREKCFLPKKKTVDTDAKKKNGKRAKGERGKGDKGKK